MTRWERFEAIRIYGQFFILPCFGLVFRVDTDYHVRVAVAWLVWQASLGVGKKGRAIDDG